MALRLPPTSFDPVPFVADVDPVFVGTTVKKAGLYQPSIDLLDNSNAGWIEGPPRDNMTALASYWASDYDWYKTQREINNNFSHYFITVPGASPEYDHPVPLHFIHERSDIKNAIPLLLLHGWPSTHLEWSKVIGPLVNPQDSSAPSFHVVAPDFPGFGFSPAPTHSGLAPRQVGLVFDSLMRRLGYERYGIVTTDLGWNVGMWMAEAVGDHLIGHFTDGFIAQPNATDVARLARNETTPQETAYIISLQTWFTQHSAYSTVQSTSPLALAQAMSDTPVGFAGWIWHLMHVVSDGYDYHFDELITDTMMLWIQGTFGNLRTYREYLSPQSMNFSRTEVPTGVTQWGSANADRVFDNLRSFHLAPRSWIERTANLVYLTTHEAGGHFPAKNMPDEWILEVQAFFKSLI